MTTTVPLCACGSPSPQATICRACTTRLKGSLDFAATIAADLDDAVAKLTVRGHGGGARTVPKSQPPADLHAMQVAGELRTVLRGWTTVIAERPDALPLPEDTIRGMARWLAAQMAVVRQHEAAQDICDEITAAVDRARKVLDWQPDGRLYAGPCPVCGTDLLGAVGDTVIACRCGTTAVVAERREAMRAMLEDQLGSVSWCASMATALGVRLTENTVKSWAQRERIVSHGTRVSAASGREYAVYRFGDVLERAAMRAVRVKGLALWTTAST